MNNALKKRVRLASGSKDLVHSVIRVTRKILNTIFYKHTKFQIEGIHID